MNFKEEYRKYNEPICPNRALVEEMKETAGMREEKKRYRAVRLLRGAVAVATICICVLVGIPVLAAEEPIYEIMYMVSPSLAQRFRAVNESDEDRGIRMEVASAYIHENEMMAYITLQDLEGDRIDATTDLYDSFSIRTPFDGYGGGGYEPVAFDEDTGVATFLVTLGQLPEKEGEMQKITGEKITFSLRKFISKKAEYDNLEVPVSWDDVQAEADTISLKLRGGSYPGVSAEADGYPRPLAELLRPGEPEVIPSVEGIQLTGMGYVDGVLHIQTMVPNLHETDNHCELFLVDKEGNRRLYDYKVNAFGATEETKATDYQDCIFDISPEELENYTLQGHFVTSGLQVEGYWSVTFPVEGQPE